MFLSALYDNDDGGQRVKYWQRWDVNGAGPLPYGQSGRYARDTGGVDEVGNWSGLLLGIAVLGRGSNLVFLPLWLFWFLTRPSRPELRRRRHPGMSFLLGCLLPLAPLFLYNMTHAKQPLLLTANGGFNLLQ